MPATLEQKFQLAVIYVHKSYASEQYGDSGRTLSNEDKLKMYKYYKQATEGPAKPEDKPSFFNLVAKAKYNAWAELKDMSKEEAMKAYVKALEDLAPEWFEFNKMDEHKKELNVTD